MIIKKPVHYKYLSIKQIRTLAQSFKDFISKGTRKDNVRRRGRPPKYSDEYILSLFFMRVIRRLSFRMLKREAEELTGEASPALSTLHYRFRRLDDKAFEGFFKRIVTSIENFLEKSSSSDQKYLFCDGTGFGYCHKISLNHKRGKEQRPTYAHVKTELLVSATDSGAYVIGVATGPSYSDERKLLKKILDNVPGLKGNYLIADALYGMSTVLLERFMKLGLIPVIPVKRGIHNDIRHPIRKLIAKNYEAFRELYKKRYIIEQVIGKIKNSYGDKSTSKTFEMASKEVLAKVIAFNYCFLSTIIFFAFYLQLKWRQFF